ncbi:YhgE/Pip domain-containing protein [Clostridium carnis]
MNFLKIAGEDIKSIFKNRFIRVSIIAIIIVPLLYSLLYLYAFWDPYAKIEDVPVAVVNLDKGATMDGDKVNYGKDIEDELRNNTQVGWKITNKEDADSGLEGKDYYAKVVIPKDFSENIISAKEGAPEVANIDFVTNDKRNFLAAQINSKVEAELKASVVKKITENYVKVTFDNLYDAKDGITKAADGSKQLHDGVTTLNDKVPELVDGVKKLDDGSNALLSGQGDLNNGINKLSNGANELAGGLGTLNGGVNQLNSGLSQVYGKVPTLSNGVNKLYGGSGLLKDGLGTANNGSKLLADGTNKLYQGYLTEVYPSVGALKAGANTLNSKLAEGQEEIALLSDGAKRVGPGTDKLVAGVGAAKDGYQAINDGTNKLIMSVSDSGKAVNAMKGALDKGLASGTVEEKNAAINQALQVIAKMQKDMADGSGDIAKLQAGLINYNNSIAQLNTKTQEYSGLVKGFAGGTAKLISNVSNVSAGVQQLSGGLDKLYAGLDPNTGKFGAGLKAVQQNTSGLSVGLTKLNEGATDLNNGLGELNSNIPALSNGVTALYSGSKALVDGSSKLAAGSNELAAGLSSAKDGSSKLLNGQGQLNNGIGELNSKVPELKDGANKLFDGTKELNEKLTEGADKMKDGLVNSSEVMGEFVSEPVDMAFNAVNKVPNYGTGFAPYFIPLSLWIGAIMMFFVIPSTIKDDKEMSKFDKVVGKYLSYSFVGVLQAVLVSVVVLMLGLKPTSVTAYVLTNIFLSLVFVAIIQCLISLLGDAGRLLGIVLLIVQLTSCAGTFPLEIVPNFFKAMNPFMPFTYAVEALREVISADVINYSILGKDIAILAVALVVFLGISVALKNVGERIAQKIEGRKSDIVA